jgi:hypothetical protein
MAKPLTPMVVTSFLGENDTNPATEIEDRQGALVQNLYIVNGGLERRLGSDIITSGYTITNKFIQGLLWCRLPATSPVEYVIGVSQGLVKDFWNAGAGGAPTDLTWPSGPFTSTSNLVGMAVVDNVLYIGDGSTDGMFRFDGTDVRRSGSEAPTTAPTFNAFVGAGALTGDVTYKLVYLDDSGHESEPSAASAVISPVAQNVTLNIANDTDGDRSGKNLYRRGTSSTQYRLVNAAPIAAGATTYTDSTTDANLGAILEEGNTRMPGLSRMWEHDGRLFGCGNAADLRTLFISNEFEPWYCPASPDLSDPTQGLRLRIQAKNAVIVGGISHGGYCFVFTDEGGYLLQGTSSDDYRLERFCNHGCTSHRSIQSLRNWLFWCGPDGVYRYDGEKTERIDDSIRTYFTARTASNLSLTCSWVYDNRYYLSFPTGVNAVKCFDTRYEPADGWTTMRYGDVYRSATVSTSQAALAGVPRVFVANDFDGSVIQLEKPGYYLDDSAAGVTSTGITATWKSKMFNMGLHGRDKRVHLWGFKVRNPTSIGDGSSTVTAAMAVSGSAMNTIADSAVMQVETLALTTTEDGDDWAVDPSGGTVATIRNEAFEQARSELFQLYISNVESSGAGISDFRILEAEAYWTLAS